MAEGNISQKFRLKNINENIDYLTEETNQNNLISKRNKKVCTTLNYIAHLLNLAFVVARSVPISAFASLNSILIDIAKSAVWLKHFAITAGIKKYKSITKKKNAKHDKIVLLAKPKLNSKEILISRALINTYISHDVFRMIWK